MKKDATCWLVVGTLSRFIGLMVREPLKCVLCSQTRRLDLGNAPANKSAIQRLSGENAVVIIAVADWDISALYQLPQLTIFTSRILDESVARMRIH